MYVSHTYVSLPLSPRSPLCKNSIGMPLGEDKKRKINSPNVPIWLRKIVSWIPDAGVSSSSIKHNLHITHTESSVRDTHGNYFKNTNWKKRLDVMRKEVC